MSVSTVPRRPASWGILDNAPPPRGPDLLVFGGWRPDGPVPDPDGPHQSCKECGVEWNGRRQCWRCGGPDDVTRFRAEATA